MKKDKPHTYKKKENGKNDVGAKEKYTADFCINELNEMMKHINSDDGSDVVLIKELCILRGFSHQRWSEITAKFADNLEISDTIKKIEDILEMRLYKAGLTNSANSTLVIFGLKNKYKWVDKIDTELTGKNGLPLIPSKTKIIFE
jgi:hypothetical protein